MTIEEHKKRHIKLHRALDELFADFIFHHPDQIEFLKMPIMKLMKWSHGQTIKPREKGEGR